MNFRKKPPLKERLLGSWPLMLVLAVILGAILGAAILRTVQICRESDSYNKVPKDAMEFDGVYLIIDTSRMPVTDKGDK
ncbi:hypothetical protein M8J76_015997 [Diaphorina citri]|nr:hypothetical protein M8J75_015332 [Diaphorina citri]KAI5719858.1 hypothetical protein M8J76_015997 [Diaphorina citri]